MNVQELIDQELKRLRKGPAPEPQQLVNELSRELGYRRRMYPRLCEQGKVGFAKVAEQLWIVEHLLEQARKQREEQTT